MHTVEITNFRGFARLRLSGLARVNLLVGSNNAGKTSVLEALHFLALGGDLRAFVASMARRSERTRRPDIRSLDVRQLFHRRSLNGPPLSVSSSDDTRRIEYSVSAVPILPEDSEAIEDWRRALSRSNRFRREVGPNDDFAVSDGERFPRMLVVSAGEEVIARAPLQMGGGLINDEDLMVFKPRDYSPVQFIGTSLLSQESLARLHDRVVLTPEEPRVIAALNTVEDSISSIAAVHQGRTDSRAIMVAARGYAEPVPLGSLGDGMSRMLAIALSLVAARDGFLLVDEIDTGLHHTVMKKMWQMVLETARRLNVTVFATSHSHDCVHALAAIAAKSEQDLALLRIERDREEAVLFNAHELSLLLQREIEPR